MFLVDTNVFLEILLKQDRSEISKNFLDSNIGSLSITDFSLHSIGVILFKYGKRDVLEKFIEDILPYIRLVSLPIELYSEIAATGNKLQLDFDDAYQYCIARYYGLRIVTMDNDFRSVEDVEILFL